LVSNHHILPLERRTAGAGLNFCKVYGDVLYGAADSRPVLCSIRIAGRLAAYQRKDTEDSHPYHNHQQHGNVRETSLTIFHLEILSVITLLLY